MVELILADFLYKAVRIMRDKECILHCIPFLETSPRLVRIETVDEISIFVPRMNETCFFIKEFLPASGQFHKPSVVSLIPESLGPLGDSIRTETVFKCMRSRELRPV